MQKYLFLEHEGDAWFERNDAAAAASRSVVLPVLSRLGLKPQRVLEIGCSSGAGLADLAEAGGAQCFGIDPSSAAIDAGQKRFPHLNLAVGTADKLDFERGSFDLVIFGFCLYLTDPGDHFAIASEADRVLADGGFLAIHDFYTPRAYRNPNKHKEGMNSYKMEWSRLFTAHPSYRLIAREYVEHARPLTFAIDEAVTVDMLIKSVGDGFPVRQR